MTKKTLLAISTHPTILICKVSLIFYINCCNLVKWITPYISYVEGSILGKCDMVRSKKKKKILNPTLPLCELFNPNFQSQV